MSTEEIEDSMRDVIDEINRAGLYAVEEVVVSNFIREYIIPRHGMNRITLSFFKYADNNLVRKVLSMLTIPLSEFIILGVRKGEPFPPESYNIVMNVVDKVQQGGREEFLRKVLLSNRSPLIEDIQFIFSSTDLLDLTGQIIDDYAKLYSHLRTNNIEGITKLSRTLGGDVMYQSAILNNNALREKFLRDIFTNIDSPDLPYSNSIISRVLSTNDFIIREYIKSQEAERHIKRDWVKKLINKIGEDEASDTVIKMIMNLSLHNMGRTVIKTLTRASAEYFSEKYIELILFSRFSPYGNRVIFLFADPVPPYTEKLFRAYSRVVHGNRVSSIINIFRRLISNDKPIALVQAFMKYLSNDELSKAKEEIMNIIQNPSVSERERRGAKEMLNKANEIFSSRRKKKGNTSSYRFNY